MNIEHNIISVSGGKDSTALLLLAIEREAENMRAVFADTGHEHPQTIEYVQFLNDHVFPIQTIRAEFSGRIAAKRIFIELHWKESLMKPRPGKWEYIGPDGIELPPEPPIPNDPYSKDRTQFYSWFPAIHPMTEMEADDKIARALDLLKPTGNPFLDLCLWKGRFPSTKARFCSEELKRNPIIEQVQKPLMAAGDDIVSWQGVRADESIQRSTLAERELKLLDANGAELWNYRPILNWTVEDVFAMHKKHGIDPNPLYRQGMGRVGCMPCIHARKDELLEISKRFPEEVARVAEWEKIVGEVSKRDSSTFFSSSDLGERDPLKAYEAGNIMRFVEWSKTSRGGKQMDFLRMQNDGPLCTSIYGLCE